MTKQRVQQLTDIMARVLHYQDSGEPDWTTRDYAATKREYDELPKPIVDRYMNDAKFHAQVHRAVAMLLELDRSSAEPSGDAVLVREILSRLSIDQKVVEEQLAEDVRLYGSSWCWLIAGHKIRIPPQEMFFRNK